MASTHPLHKDFDTDLKRWKDQIKYVLGDDDDVWRTNELAKWGIICYLGFGFFVIFSDAPQLLFLALYCIITKTQHV